MFSSDVWIKVHVILLLKHTKCKSGTICCQRVFTEHFFFSKNCYFENSPHVGVCVWHVTDLGQIAPHMQMHMLAQRVWSEFNSAYLEHKGIVVFTVIRPLFNQLHFNFLGVSCSHLLVVLYWTHLHFASSLTPPLLLCAEGVTGGVIFILIPDGNFSYLLSWEVSHAHMQPQIVTHHYFSMQQ